MRREFWCQSSLKGVIVCVCGGSGSASCLFAGIALAVLMFRFLLRRCSEMCYSSKQLHSCGHGFVSIVLWLKVLVRNSHPLIYVTRGDRQPHVDHTMQ
jgi:hypothetical protein